MLLLDQNGREITDFTPRKFSVKLQAVGAADEYAKTFCAVLVQSKGMSLPLAVGIYRSEQMARAVAADLINAGTSERTFYQMPPSSITPLELLERISAE